MTSSYVYKQNVENCVFTETEDEAGLENSQTAAN